MKLRLLTAAMLVVTPLAAQALGLGRLVVDSGLDEPLNGQIELISPTSQEIKTLKASLASREDFDIAGIERPPHLFDIKYTVTQKSDGRYFLKVHTDQPIREPFLHFLVQVEWNGGRLIREYTTLLDPPQWVEGAPADISVPATAAIEELPELVPEPVVEAPVEPTAAVEPGIAEAAEAEKTQLGLAEAAAPAAPAAAVPSAEAAAAADTAPQPAPETQPAPATAAGEMGAEVGPLAAAPAAPVDTTPAQAVEPAAPVAASAATSFEYGPVRKGETLSRIAGQITPDATLTSQQVMIALLRANPQAFYNNNVNILRAGKILRIPDREQIAAVSRGEAAREYQVQYDAWQEYKLKLAGASRMVAVASEEPKPAAEPEAPKAAAKKKDGKAVRADKTGKGAVKAEPVDLLRIVRANLEQEIAEDSTKTPGVETKQDGSKEQRALGERVATLEEAIESKQMQNKDLRDRVGKLQEQVKNTERLIDLENKDLALAQKQAAEKAAAEKLAAEKAAADKAAAEKAALEKAEAEKLAAEKAAAEKLAADKAAADKAAAEKLAVEKAAADKAAAEKAAQAQPPTPAAVPPAAPAAKKPVPAPPPAPEPESGFLDGILASVLDNSMALAMLAGIGVLAAGVGGLYAYRRRRASREFSESILTGTSLTTESSLSDTSAPSGASDTSFLSDFSQGGMGNIHTDEVDPIAEAEVYLAYGRDEQAEEILKDAIVKDPVRQELKGKLLEIYFQRNDAGAFETLAEELYAQLEGKGGKVWDKVEEMGRKLSPSNPMFRGGRPAVAAAPVAATTLMASAAPHDTGATTMLVSGSAPSASAGLDFTSMSIPESAPEPAAPSSGGGLDFNINFDSTPAPEPAASGLDMSFDLDTAASEAAAPSGGLDMDLRFGAPAESTSNLIDFSAPSQPESGGIEFDSDAGTSLGGDAIEFTSGMSDGGDIELDVAAPSEVGEAALPGWDETATKLDLAKAYIDMGDSEGARSILDEVLAEGNDQQKRQARELAAQIAA